MPINAAGVAPYSTSYDNGPLHQPGFDKLVHMALRPLASFRSAITMRELANVTNTGDTYNFFIDNDFAIQTTPLDEVDDGTGTAGKLPTAVPVVVKEYGNYTITTQKAEYTDLSESVKQRTAEKIAYNGFDSIETLVERVLASSTNVVYPTAEGGTTTLENGVTPGNLNANTIRAVMAQLKKAHVRPINGQYIVFIAPSVAADLRSATDPAAWRQPHTYVDPAELYNWDLGTFEGFTFIENDRILPDEDGVYNTYFMGADAVCEAINYDLTSVVNGTIVDVYDRKTAFAWKAFLGWALFRKEALVVVKSVPSLGVITTA